ncbi:hypothetical protein DN523_27095 [Burkholderia multivorans]|uniref:hypothetical protein n=1 Tax=Burkholderia multivorans TaxID=87883 RepID=UPI000DABB1D9|nr:hypothetical protein [Burkholderia multivorans]MBR8049349.1 hypothetical protein [Burkholderia multivorans]MBR8122441.1 hypothetical protein [Burkholderia multivorans]MBU9164347.1 hypothetical protein [Burkholderia multivorans]MBU9445008.1 hypothetical protein [Burkholderia multivorans]MBU9450834.1 hypothetical protein [Burkholderia multivorans]
MDYVTKYADLVYFSRGRIIICRYRFLTLAANPKQLIIQVETYADQRDPLIADHIGRDGILNRIADRDLVGIPFDMLCVVLSNAGQHSVVFVEADLEDYIHRGHLYQRTPQRTARGRHIERISIDSRHLVVGKARLQTTHATPSPATDDLVAILNLPASA